MSGLFKYIISIILIGLFFAHPRIFHFVLPIMEDDEYFVDENCIIHSDNCPYKGVPWFAQKFSKYEILIKKGEEICNECLLQEEDKLWDLHYINLELLEKFYRRNGANEKYIEQKLNQFYGWKL